MCDGLLKDWSFLQSRSASFIVVQFKGNSHRHSNKTLCGFKTRSKRIERCRSVEAMDCPIGKRAWHRNWLSKRILEWSTVVLIVGYLFFLVGFFLLARSLRSLACLSLDLKVSLLVIPSLRSVIRGFLFLPSLSFSQS